MQVTIAAIGQAKTRPEASLVQDYLKRLPWKVKLVEMEAKASLPPAKKKIAEAELLLAATEAADLRIALDERGKPLGSEPFARQIQAWQNEGIGHLAFILGGADGLDESVRKASRLVLCFGTMTWPHHLARAMLAEQLYRVHTILSGHPYHRA